MGRCKPSCARLRASTPRLDVRSPHPPPPRAWHARSARSKGIRSKRHSQQKKLRWREGGSENRVNLHEAEVAFSENRRTTKSVDANQLWSRRYQARELRLASGQWNGASNWGLDATEHQRFPRAADGCERSLANAGCENGLDRFRPLQRVRLVWPTERSFFRSRQSPAGRLWTEARNVPSHRGLSVFESGRPATHVRSGLACSPLRAGMCRRDCRADETQPRSRRSIGENLNGRGGSRMDLVCSSFEAEQRVD